MEIQPFQITGVVEEVLVANQYGNHISTPVDKVTFMQGRGILHDNHSSPRLLDVRDAIALRFGLPKGMEVFNTRQWSAVSREESDEISEYMGIPSIDRGLLGENMVVRGIPSFTKLPPGTQLFFRSPKGERRTTILFVCGENFPCRIPGDAIQACYQDKKGLSAMFVDAGMHRRGLVGFVVGSGFVKKGDTIIAQIPQQSTYDPSL